MMMKIEMSFLNYDLKDFTDLLELLSSLVGNSILTIAGHTIILIA